MNLSDLIHRNSPPAPWEEGDNIPWNDPAFSKRMLKEHLSQSHDKASRRSEAIDRHVEWIYREVLSGEPSGILDLGCGPGLYLHRLAELGHQCKGIDYSPASVEYAIDRAEEKSLSIRYIHQDIRQADFGTDFDLVMLIFGELNVFSPTDAEMILKKACRALKQGGILLLEPHTYEVVQKIGEQPCSWHSTESGLFSDKPHMVLQENFWDTGSKTATTRYFIIDGETGGVTHYAATYQAYTDSEYRALLQECGFSTVRQYPSLPGDENNQQEGLFVLHAQK